MNAYKYKITIPASSEQEANMMMEALKVLSSNLKATELNKLADIVKNDPIKTAMAKKALGV